MPNPRSSELLKMGALARAAGVSDQMIRHYERMGLIPPPRRSPGGFRLFSEATIDRIHLIRKIRSLGFSLEETRRLLEQDLRTAEGRRNCQLILARKREELSQRTEELRVRIDTLGALHRACESEGTDSPFAALLADIELEPGDPAGF